MNNGTMLRSKTDGTTWTVVKSEYVFNAWLGEHATHTTLRGHDGFELRLADTDEDEWNDLVVVRRGGGR